MANAHDIAKCFLFLDDASDGDGISNLKLQKLLYYSQGFFAAIFGLPLFSNQIEAWAHGPVVPEIYHTYKEYGGNWIPVPNDFNKEALSEDEFGLVEEVFEVFGQYSAWKLRDMTHEETPWKAHESDASIIPIEEIIEYFETRIN